MNGALPGSRSTRRFLCTKSCGILTHEAGAVMEDAMTLVRGGIRMDKVRKIREQIPFKRIGND